MYLDVNTHELRLHHKHQITFEPDGLTIALEMLEAHRGTVQWATRNMAFQQHLEQ